ncbi:MAG: hypothetical protein DRJ03_13675 [Chloroflexi bacterium]|nr:MAG: hypothetical protein B6I35_14370 [Anaerolineaceae bacterium 4572_32.2]RLC84635.1 MAG: hypothetical protein DRJ03_13675 [Chloroflexota bacterium]
MQQTTADEQKMLLVLALACILFSISFAVILNRNYSTLYRSDIFFRWYATEKLFSENRNLYDSQNEKEVTTFVYGSPRKTNFYYPAHLIIFTGLLALLPYPIAHIVWTTTVQIFFVVSVWLSMRLADWPGSINKLTLFLVMSIFFIPSLQHAIWGQFNSIGLLSLVLCYQALRHRRYTLAGVLAGGLTFKPHTTALTLLFLLTWAIFERERWGFYLGFLFVGLAMWASAEIFQPGWVFDFLAILEDYNPAQSVIERVWNPQVLAGALVLASGAILLHNRRATAKSSAFAGCIALSLAIWPLVVPIIGMLHTIVLPVAAVMVLSGLKRHYPSLYIPALYSMLLVYVLGIVGFFVGLSSPELYGMHIAWSELAYKITAPILIALFSVPLCLKPSD